MRRRIDGPWRGAWMALVVLAGTSLPAAEPTRPNLVLVVVDDLGYGEPGCYGSRDGLTPRLDALAQQGTRFSQGYVTAPFCAASRAALLTGRYQTRFGFEFNPIGARNADPAIGLPPGELTIADRLRGVGYATALIGKWHLGGTDRYHPQRRGFDEFFGFLHEGHYFVPAPWQGVRTWLRRTTLPDGARGLWTSPDGRVFWSTQIATQEPPYDAGNPLLRGSQPTAESAHLTEAFTREACDFITRHRAQPFFLCLAYNAVHSPMQATDAYWDRLAHIADPQRRIFAALLAQWDAGLGRVVDTLAQHGLNEQTLVVVVSDNGGPTKELTSRNDPLRGGKGELYEGGIRVPLVIRWPSSLRAKPVIDAPISTLDVSTTMLDLAGVTIRAEARDGLDLRPLVAGAESTLSREALYWRVGRQAAIRQGDWKAVRRAKPGVEEAWELYDLAHDLSEARNQAAAEPERLRALVALWERWSGAQRAPLWE